MISTPWEREAENEAESLIKRLKITGLPVCPFTIAKGEDILVEPKDSDEPGVSGFLMRVGNVFGIQYATHLRNDGFIRFSVGHELGHYFLPGHPEYLFPNGDGIHRSRSGFISSDQYERQADCFATVLLMPKTFFMAALRKAGEGFAAIQSLAETCQTSITATAIRFAQFAEDPVAIIVSTGARVEYCFLSEELKGIRGLEWLRKGALIPSSSVTAHFNRDHNNVSQSRQVEGYIMLDEWFGSAPQIEMQEDVVGLGSYGKTLTVLFTNQAIDDEDEEFDED